MTSYSSSIVMQEIGPKQQKFHRREQDGFIKCERIQIMTSTYTEINSSGYLSKMSTIAQPYMKFLNQIHRII